uniref:Uncharacterized protein n=1 Tax=Ananas comosus var. bracteatus TaxID=296719 RepID=A0A6V7PKK1_ANACO|nr:unnamed protein product [Ananas comosus var. bracteatus]
MAAGGSWWRRGAAELQRQHLRPRRFLRGIAGIDRGILVAILAVTCVILAVILLASAVWLYWSRLALADWVRGSPGRAPEERWAGPGRKSRRLSGRGRSQSSVATLDPICERQVAPIEPDGHGGKDDGEHDAAHYEDRDEDPAVAAGGPCVEVDVVEGAAGEAGLRVLGRPVSSPRADRHLLFELDRDTLHTRLGSAHEFHSGVRLCAFALVSLMPVGLALHRSVSVEVAGQSQRGRDGYIHSPRDGAIGAGCCIFRRPGSRQGRCELEPYPTVRARGFPLLQVVVVLEFMYIVGEIPLYTADLSACPGNEISGA